VLQREARNCLDRLLEQTNLHSAVNPLSFLRCSSINVILSTAFGVPGVTPDDQLFKDLVYAIETGLHFASAIGDISAHLPILSFLDVIFQKEKKTRDTVHNVSRLL
jgi:hypothetical protein